MAAAEMGEVDEIHSNEESIKDGASINGDLSDYKDDDENTNEMDDEVVAVANDDTEDILDHDQIISDNEKSDDDDISIHNIGDGDSGEEMDKMDMEGMEAEDDDMVEHVQETDNSDTDDEEKDKIIDMSQSDGEDEYQEDKDKIIDMTNGLNSSDEAILENDMSEDVVMLDDKDILDDKDPIENGSVEVDSSDEVEISEPTSTLDDEVINIDDTPVKKKKKERTTDLGPPRRSSRNLNKEKKSYIETEEEVVIKAQKKQQPEDDSSEESDIEEVLPQDPLAVADPTPSSIPSQDDKMNSKKSCMSSSTIVVKDTKCLAEIASKSTANNNNNSKKEPTLVIIDTNSILSGRGPVPISSQKPAISTPISNSFSMLPMALPAQGIYPANMRATITPIPMTPAPSTPTPKPTPPPPPPPPVLPTLTDDMFVVEAPSFIVPYVYEKPPIKELKDFIKSLESEIAENKKDEEKGKDEGDKKKAEEEGKNDKTISENEKENKKEDGSIKDKIIDADLPSIPIPTATTLAAELRKPPTTYFDSPLGKFFMGIGYSLVQEAVQSDLLKQQKRKRDREAGQNPETMRTINSLVKNLEYTKENNEPYHMEMKKCEFCSFRTESALAMAYHLETPHMKNYVYRCNFCAYEVRSPHDILFHMEVQHGVRGRLERAPAFHQCPNCPFEDNQKGKLSRHLVACMRKFKPDRNLEPPVDFEPPAKIPRAPRMKQQGLGSAAAVYQAMARTSQYQMMSKMPPNLPVMQRGRGRPSLGTNIKPQPGMRPTVSPASMLYKQASMSGSSVLVPTNYQLTGNQMYQQQQQQQQSVLGKMKPVQQPSISITPLPRGTTSTGMSVTKPGDANPKNSFVICEICDGYIKDLEQLRNHMQWIHKVKIHPKMIYNRPPLNCQKCQFRFFTDQGLERHLLGSHGLVTSSMQEAANRSKDAGRCPVCGRVYQWKLLNHVARDHNMTLKPAHLSYKCTVCTATFGMYKQFESHVYSAHSVVAKRVMDKKNASGSSINSTGKSESVLKPLKINDEITIIPQPAKLPNEAGSSKEESGTFISGTSISARNSVGYSNGNPGTSKSKCNA